MRRDLCLGRRSRHPDRFPQREGDICFYNIVVKKKSRNVCVYFSGVLHDARFVSTPRSTLFTSTRQADNDHTTVTHTIETCPDTPRTTEPQPAPQPRAARPTPTPGVTVREAEGRPDRAPHFRLARGAHTHPDPNAMLRVVLTLQGGPRLHRPSCTGEGSKIGIGSFLPARRIPTRGA